MNYNISDYPKISMTISKLGGVIPTINLPAVVTCNPDAPCTKKGCYACKGNFCFESAKKSLKRNLESYIRSPENYFAKIDLFLAAAPYRFFRYHSSGDIVNERYLELMFELAKKHPKTRFLCFTKKYKLVNEYIEKNENPKNLILVYSNWGEWKCENPHNLPTAWVRFNEETEIPDDAIECTGYCAKCVNTETSCWDLQNGMSVVFKKH